MPHESVVGLLDIDRLDIVISAEASKAEKQLNKLMTALEKLSTVLNGLNTSSLNGLANSVQKLSIAMQGMNAIKTTDFTRLAKNIQKLAGIDTKSLNNAASSMSIIGKALSGLGTASANAQAIGDMAKNLSKLGNKGIQNAISNMPQLASALKNMMQTLQSAPRVSNNLIRMTEAMGKLASNGNRVGSSARSLNSGFRSYGSYADTATKKTRSLASAIGMLYAKFWFLQRALRGLFGAVESAMDFTETVNYFSVAMRKIGDDASSKWSDNGYSSAEEYADSFSKRLKELTSKMTGFEVDGSGNIALSGSKSLGMDPNKVMQYQAQYAQMADSIGMTEESAIRTSKALTMLGADWASLRNISFDQAWEKFASALAGQSRAVRSLGIDITQATLQEYAYKYGLETAVSEMNQATKAQLRLLAILDQSKVAYGDLANTIQTPANQLRLFRDNLSNLARLIGNIFIPVVARAMPYINGFVLAIQRLFIWIGKLLGVNIGDFSSAVGGMSDSIADLGEEDVIGNIADNADNAADAINNANNAAEKLKRTVFGFDELNILNDNSDDTSNTPTSNFGSTGLSIPDIGDVGLLDNAIADALADYERIWNEAFGRMENRASDFADKIEKAFKKIWKTAEPTRKALKKLWNEGFSKLGNFTFTALKDFYSDFLVPVGRWTLGTGLPKFINITNSFLNNINWTRINTSLKEFWKALAPFATNIGEGLIEFYNDLLSVGADFINNVVPGGLDALASALKKISPETAQKIGYSLGIVATGILAFKTLSPVVGILSNIASAFTKWNTLKDTFKWLGGVKYFGIAAGLTGVVVALDKFGVIDVDWEWLRDKIGQIKDILSEFISNVDVSGLANTLGNLWDAFQPFAEGFADAFISAFDILVNDIGAPLINGLADAFKWLSEKLGGLNPEFLESLGTSIGILAINIKAIKIGKTLTEDLLTLITRFNGIRDSLSGTGTGKPLADMINEAGQAIGDTVGETGGKAERAGNSFSGFWSSALNLGASAALIDLFSHTKQVMEDTKNITDDEVTSFGAVTQALKKLADQGIITNTQLTNMLPTLEEGMSGAFNFDESFQRVIDSLEEAGISSDTFKSALSTAMEESAVASNEYTQKISEYLGAAEESIGNLSGTAQADFSTIDRTVSDASDNIWSVTDSTWSDSYKAVTDSLNAMKGASSEKMRQIFANVKSYTNSIWNITANNWDAIGKKISDVLGDINDDISSELDSAVQKFSSLGSRISGSIGDLYSVGRNAAQSFANGISSVHIPMPHISIDSSTSRNGNGYSYRMNSAVNWYANGGFPNAGELFMARENGPELVGRMGHKNVVANNKQITEGIKSAVIDGMMEVYMATNTGQDNNNPYILNVTVKTEDNEVLARAVEKGRLKRDARFKPIQAY